MKHLLLVAVLLSACGSVTPPAAAGTVTGTVTAAPCSPVVRLPTPTPCPPSPNVTVDFGGTRAVSDASGVYRIELPPGTYAISVTSGARHVPATPGQVTVAAGQTVTLNLTFDSGIR